MRVSAQRFPAIQIGLRFLQTLETHAFSGVFAHADSGFHFAFAIGIAHAARAWLQLVVRQHIAVDGLSVGS